MLALVFAFVGMLGLASPASAHNASLAAVAECQADGTYLVTYTVTWKSVPTKAIGSPIVARTDSDGTHDDGWQGNPDAYSWTDHGTVTSAEGSTSWTETLPGDTAGRWAYSWVKWTNSYQGDRFQETQIVGLGGDCQAPPQTVTVSASFGDNTCVDNVYTEPTLTAPDVAGTTKEVTGTVAPGETVTVVYSPETGYTIEGPSTFTHTYPANPASDADCPDVAGEEEEQPEQPQTTTPDTPEVAGVQATVPTAVDAGLAAAPATGHDSGLPVWLTTVLGGMLLVGLGGLMRIRSLRHD